MSKSCFLAVYSDIVGSIWTGEVDLNQPAGHLRREIYGECLQGLLPPGTSSAQLSLYYVEDGIVYEPEDTFRQRLSNHVIVHEPRKIGLLSRLCSVIDSVEEDRVYLIIGLPDKPLVTVPNTRSTVQDVPGSVIDSDADDSHSAPSAETVPSEADESPELEHRRAVTTSDGLPVEVFGPSFAHFIGLLKNAPSSFDATFTALVVSFLKTACTVDLQNLSQAESLTHAFVELISPGGDDLRIRHVPEIAYGCIYTLLKNKVRKASAPIVVFKAMSAGGPLRRRVDRAMRTGIFSCDCAWPVPDRKIIYGECTMPVFGVTIVDSWLRIYGSVYTNKRISQQLTTAQKLPPHSELEPTTVQAFVRVFWTLRESIAHLHNWYHALMTSSRSQFHHRLHPASNSFTDSSGTEVKFNYLRPLYPYNHLFIALARFPDPRSFIVKFTPTYCGEAHRLLAQQNLAPALLYAGPVYDYAGYTRWKMVVMEECTGGGHVWWDVAGEPIYQQVRDAVRVLHENGFVHGDLRSQNIMLDKALRIRVIDFDWAGKEGVARYPNDLSPDIPWPAGAKPGALISREHDQYWVRRLLTPRFGTR